MSYRTLIAVAAVALLHCETKPVDAHIAAAGFLRKEYASSPLAKWDVRVQAAGDDCDVLLFQTSLILDAALIEAIHYGIGPYDVYRGGVYGFYRERAFRGVAYQDVTGKVWTYGSVTESEAKSLSPCD